MLVDVDRWDEDRQQCHGRGARTGETRQHNRQDEQRHEAQRVGDEDCVVVCSECALPGKQHPYEGYRERDQEPAEFVEVGLQFVEHEPRVHAPLLDRGLDPGNAFQLTFPTFDRGQFAVRICRCDFSVVAFPGRFSGNGGACADVRIAKKGQLAARLYQCIELAFDIGERFLRAFPARLADLRIVHA